jgi:hypothetical protein
MLHKMVYVDEPIWKKPNGKMRYSHMTADSLMELHSFAKLIGVGRCWFHRGSHPHYDINEKHFSIAIANGAKVIKSRQLVEIAKKLYK